MGTSNLMAVAKSDNIVALCDCDTSEAAKAALVRNGIPEKFPKAAMHQDFRKMFETQKDIDAVVVATPDHNHAVVAMAAMQLGKHVYVQKPLTRTIWEARTLTEAARKYKVVSQMGNQGHSGEGASPHAGMGGRRARSVPSRRSTAGRTARSGRRATRVRPTRRRFPRGWTGICGSARRRCGPYNPAYHPFSWRAWQDFGAGAMGDMACHVMDAACTILKLGAPSSIIATKRSTSFRSPARRVAGQQARRLQRQLSAGVGHPRLVPCSRRDASRQAALV
jgi:hypothetical protein